MKRVLPDALHSDIDRIKPTSWKLMKTEALDFGANFIWFDNDIFPEEWEVLKKCGPNQRVVHIDLLANTAQLEEVVRDVL